MLCDSYALDQTFRCQKNKQNQYLPLFSFNFYPIKIVESFDNSSSYNIKHRVNRLVYFSSQDSVISSEKQSTTKITDLWKFEKQRGFEKHFFLYIIGLGENLIQKGSRFIESRSSFKRVSEKLLFDWFHYQKHWWVLSHLVKVRSFIHFFWSKVLIFGFLEKLL